MTACACGASLAATEGHGRLYCASAAREPRDVLPVPTERPPAVTKAQSLYPLAVRMPQAFVNLSSIEDDFGVRAAVEPVPDTDDLFRKNMVTFAVSREMALDYGLVEPTPEEAAERKMTLERFRVEEAARRAAPGPGLTMEGLLELLGWSPAYAEHVLHPACTCTPLSDDPYLCSWAAELGFVRDWETSRVEQP